MKSVIFIEPQGTNEKPVEFTHLLNPNAGWTETYVSPADHDKVVYLGKCDEAGDMFAVYCYDEIIICKGHLNSGKY